MSVRNSWMPLASAIHGAAGAGVVSVGFIGMVPGCAAFRSRHLGLDELPFDLAVLGVAEEVAFFLGAVVIVAAVGAAAVGGQRRRADLPLGEAVEMAVEHRLEVVLLEAFEDLVGVGHPRRGQRPEREMRE